MQIFTIAWTTCCMYLLVLALGCPDILEVHNAWIERRDDVTVVKCNFTSETYYLTCENTRWKGDLTRCAAQRKTLIYSQLFQAIIDYFMKSFSAPLC